MGYFRAPSAATGGKSHAIDPSFGEVVSSVCDAYGIDARHVRVVQMTGVRGGLGNAIPLPLPFRRRYVVRFHRCIANADPLAARGLFAHELMHVLHYARASYGCLWRFMLRYAAFSLSAATRWPLFQDWVRQIEHLTDLLAVHYGEGASIAAWKQFKAHATDSGWIQDSWDHMYLRDGEISALAEDRVELEKRIEACVTSLRARSALQPFAKPGP